MKLFTLFRNELTKQKRSWLWPVVFILPVGATGAMFLDMAIRYKDYLYGEGLKNGMTSWEILLIENHHILGWGLFMPLFVAVISAMVYDTEFRQSGWKNLLCLPVGRGQIYLAKSMAILFFAYFMILLNGIGLYVVGKCSGFPEPFAFATYGHYILYQFASILCVIALQNWLGSYFKNISHSVIVGVIGMVVSYSIFYDHSAIARFYFYDFVMFADGLKRGAPAIGIYGSIGLAIVFYILGWLEFKRRDIS